MAEHDQALLGRRLFPDRIDDTRRLGIFLAAMISIGRSRMPPIEHLAGEIAVVHTIARRRRSRLTAAL